MNSLDTTPSPLIDSHVHLFPKKLMRAIFSFFEKQYGWKLPFKADPAILLDILLAQGVDKAFTLAYTHKPGLSRSINKWLAGFCRENPCLVPFGAIHPLDPDPDQVVAECLDRFHFPGMKLHCLVQQCRPDDEILYPLYEAIVSRSKGIIIHAGSFPQPAGEYLSVSFIENLLKRFPGLNLVIPHLGLNELPAYRDLLAEYEGLYLDTAFVFQNRIVKPPLDEIMALMHAYPERIIYGSDFPLILEPPQNGIRRIMELELPRENYHDLFYNNAARFLSRITQ